MSFTIATLVSPTQRTRVTAIEFMKAPHTPLLIVELLMRKMTRRALVGVKELRMWLLMAQMTTQTTTGSRGVAMESVVARMIIKATIGAKVLITGLMTAHMTIQVMDGVKDARLGVSMTLVANGVEVTIPAMLGVKETKDGNINSLDSYAAAAEEDEDNCKSRDDISTPTLVEPKNWMYHLHWWAVPIHIGHHGLPKAKKLARHCGENVNELEIVLQVSQLGSFLTN